MESRDASFFEDIFPMRAVGSTSLNKNNHTHMYDPKHHHLNLLMKITHHLKKITI
jgi:hypothetical protein